MLTFVHRHGRVWRSRDGGSGGLSLLRVFAAATRFLAVPALLLLVSGCAAGCQVAAVPKITPLNPPAPREVSTKPIAIRGSVVDAATHRPVQLAHITYNRQATNSDANGAFS